MRSGSEARIFETEIGVVAETRLGKMLSQKSKTGTEPRPYLRNKNVQWGRIEIDDLLAMDVVGPPVTFPGLGSNVSI